MDMDTAGAVAAGFIPGMISTTICDYHHSFAHRE